MVLVHPATCQLYIFALGGGRYLDISLLDQLQHRCMVLAVKTFMILYSYPCYYLGTCVKLSPLIRSSR